MFSSNVTPAEDFALAAKLGAIINFDDITHIDFFEKIAPFPETMSCRYNPGRRFQNRKRNHGYPAGCQVWYDPFTNDRGIPKTQGKRRQAFWYSRIFGIQHRCQ